MLLFELVIALLLIGAVLALWAEHIGVPYPAVLALAGVGLALIPRTPQVMLDPELALALFVAPVLLDAAYDASPRDLKQNLLPVSSLAVVAVLVTVAAVAAVVHRVVPGIGWAPAIALGAIVAPPDASAATAVLRKLQPPHRLLVVLEGESLFNGPDRPFVSVLRREYEARLQSGVQEVPFESMGESAGALAALQRRAVAAQRQTLVDLRTRNIIGDDAFHALEEEIDLLELTADVRIRPSTDDVG